MLKVSTCSRGVGPVKNWMISIPFLSSIPAITLSQYAFDSVTAFESCAFELNVFSMLDCGGFSPAAAAHMPNCESAMCPSSCAMLRTSGVGLNEYNSSGTFSAVRATTPLIIPNWALTACVAGLAPAAGAAPCAPSPTGTSANAIATTMTFCSILSSVYLIFTVLAAQPAPSPQPQVPQPLLLRRDVLHLFQRRDLRRQLRLAGGEHRLRQEERHHIGGVRRLQRSGRIRRHRRLNAIEQISERLPVPSLVEVLAGERRRLTAARQIGRMTARARVRIHRVAAFRLRRSVHGVERRFPLRRDQRGDEHRHPHTFPARPAACRARYATRASKVAKRPSDVCPLT